VRRGGVEGVVTILALNQNIIPRPLTSKTLIQIVTWIMYPERRARIISKLPCQLIWVGGQNGSLLFQKWRIEETCAFFCF